jgi:hypothetical protein
MQEIKLIIEQICNHFKVVPTDTAKKKYGKLPEYSYEDILLRILQSNEGSISNSFTEMSRSALISLFKRIFPGKTLDKQQWPTYILACIDSKKCSNCKGIKAFSQYYPLAREGLSTTCKECESTRHKETYIDNKAEISARNKAYNTSNKEAIKESVSKYYQTHQAESKARSLKYKLNKALATPKWANMEKMNNIYANREDGEHVDHIVPLQGDIVCGLHWEHNLQYLTAEQNISKSNKFDQDTYIHEIP